MAISKLLSEPDSRGAKLQADIELLLGRFWWVAYRHAVNADLYLRTAAQVASRAERLAEGHEGEISDDELTSSELVAGIALLNPLRDQIDDLEADLLDSARKLGISWERLAPALKVSDRRAAQKRATRLWGRYPRRFDRWNSDPPPKERRSTPTTAGADEPQGSG